MHDIKILQAQPYKGQCVKCGGSPKSFKRHDSWSRSFRCVIENLVYIFSGCLVRHKCPLCHKTFTILPSFAAPYKRYITNTIVEKSENYLQDPILSTEKAVLNKGMSIGYENNDQLLANSTVWRWTEFLGSQELLLPDALSLIAQKEPQNNFFRENTPVPFLKYRSEKRKQRLESAQLFIRAHHFFKREFSHSLFPRFATGFG